MASVLIIEDDLRLATFIQMTLQAKGYATHLALTGDAGLRCLADTAIDLILLDLDLPDISGLQLCRQLRHSQTLPIVIFSAEGQVQAKVEALEAGANDYIVKPIDIRELLARVQAQIEAVTRQKAPLVRCLGQLRYCALKQQFSTPDCILHLSDNEYRLLLALFDCAGQVLSKADLYNRLALGEYLPGRDGHLIEVKISRLRKQLKKCASRCQILPAYGKGYYLTAEVAAGLSALT